MPTVLRKLNSPDKLLPWLVLLTMVAGFVSIALSQLLLGASLLTFLIATFRTRCTARTGLELSAGLLAVWALVNIAFSTDPGTSLIFYRRFYLFSALWVTARVFGSEVWRLRLLMAVMIGAVAIALFGEVRLLQETGSLLGHRFNAMSNAMTSGSLLMMALLLGSGFLLAGGLKSHLRNALILMLIPVLLGVLLTLTRSALLGLLAGVGLMLLLTHRRWFLVFALGVLLVLVVVLVWGDSFLPESIMKRLNLDQLVSGHNTQARLQMWQGGWRMLQERPWTGFGDRSLDTLGPQYYGNESTIYHGHLHNNFIQLAVIWGVPGLLLGTWFLVMPLPLLLTRWRHLQATKSSQPLLRAWVLGALGTWLGFFLAGLTEWYFGDAESMLIYFLFLGCALAPAEAQDQY